MIIKRLKLTLFYSVFMVPGFVHLHLFALLSRCRRFIPIGASLDPLQRKVMVVDGNGSASLTNSVFDCDKKSIGNRKLSFNGMLVLISLPTLEVVM